MFAVALGDPFNGLVFFGPFATFVDAVEWAETRHDDLHWHVVELGNPE